MSESVRRPPRSFSHSVGQSQVTGQVTELRSVSESVRRPPRPFSHSVGQVPGHRSGHRAEVRVGERQTATPTVQPLCGTGPGSRITGHKSCQKKVSEQAEGWTGKVRVVWSDRNQVAACRAGAGHATGQMAGHRSSHSCGYQTGQKVKSYR